MHRNLRKKTDAVSISRRNSQPPLRVYPHLTTGVLPVPLSCRSSSFFYSMISSSSGAARGRYGATPLRSFWWRKRCELGTRALRQSPSFCHLLILEEVKVVRLLRFSLWNFFLSLSFFFFAFWIGSALHAFWIFFLVPSLHLKDPLMNPKTMARCFFY